MAHRCRAYPTPEQAAMLSRTFGCVRVVWNRTLAARQARYATAGTGMSYRDTDAALTALKRDPDLAWLNEVSSVPLQQTLRHQHKAFQAYFAKRARHPRFKSRHGRQSATFTRSAFRIRDGALWLAKTSAPLRTVWSWPDVDLGTLNPTTVVVSRDLDGRWFVTFLVELSDPAPLAPTDKSVGVDLGLTYFAALSTGEKIAHPHDMARHERRLKRYQRMLARRQRGSKNRAKARVKVARQHPRVADARRDFLHKTSTALIRRFDVIAVEDLNVRGMTAKGSARKRGLNRSIARAGWAEFRAMLAYKAERTGRSLIVADRWYPSSKTCSGCGPTLASLSLGTRHWQCPSCGARHDRDTNAAKNVLAAGLAVTACGADLRPQGTSLRLSAVKQEPLTARSGTSRPLGRREVKSRR
jgi:putative transposase